MKTANLNATMLAGCLFSHPGKEKAIALLTSFKNNHYFPSISIGRSIGLLIVSCLFSATAFAAVQTHGPVAGGVTQTAADIFVRTDSAATVQVQFAPNENLTRSRTSTSVTTSSTTDFTAQVRLTNLIQNREYHYRVLVNGAPQQTSPYPKFSTFPPTTQTSEFSFAVASDVRNSSIYPTDKPVIYEKIQNDNPAFMVQIGDYDHSNPTTLTLMRSMHRRLQGAETGHGLEFIPHIGSQMPFFHVWDDHDIGRNNADKTYSGRAIARQAFAEYYSTSLLANPSAGVWHSFRYGPAEFFLIDARSQRDVATDVDNSSKSMLDGDNITNGQKAWLFNGLLNSTAKWKFILTPVPFNITCKPTDSWGAYKTERNELLAFLDANDISGVIALSGDAHTGGAIDTGVNAGIPEMAIPHTNLLPNQTASGPAGIWNMGLISGNGEAGQGYGLITVDDDEVLLEAKDRNGATRLSYLLH